MYSELSSEDKAESNGDHGKECPVRREPKGIQHLSKEMSDFLIESGCPVSVAISSRLRFESLLSELSATFVNVSATQVDSKIDEGLRKLTGLLGVDRVGLGEVSPDGHEFKVTHSYQRPGVPPSAKLILSSQFPTFANRLCQGKIVRLPDDMPPEPNPEREYCKKVGLTSNLTIPLSVIDRVVGGIGFSFFGSDQILPDELIPRLRLIGDIFTNALARKRADEEIRVNEASLRQTQKRLEQLAAQLLNAQEEERRRIAREMHDDWTQRLAILGMETAKLDEYLGERGRGPELLADIRTQLMNLSEDVHDLSRQLHPSILDDLGLVEALRSECACFSKRNGIRIEYQSCNVPDNIPTSIALGIYRVAQEGLRNIAKHASVDRASVVLTTVGHRLRLLIQDSGAGFDTHQVRTYCGLGISSIEERVRFINGQVSIQSSPGNGTTIEVQVPCSSELT